MIETVKPATSPCHSAMRPSMLRVRRKQAPPGGGRHVLADLGLVEGDISGPKAPPSRLVLRPRVANEQGV